MLRQAITGHIMSLLGQCAWVPTGTGFGHEGALVAISSRSRHRPGRLRSQT